MLKFSLNIEMPNLSVSQRRKEEDFAIFQFLADKALLFLNTSEQNFAILKYSMSEILSFL